MDLAEFVAARLDEDEATAKANAGDGGLGEFGPSWPGYQTYTADDSDEIARAEFLARFWPLRQLREVEAKRKILAEHEHGSERDRKFGFGPGSSPCRTLRALAAVWNDHPDYDPAWR